MVKERMNKLRQLMAKEHMDAYIIPTNDFHLSEYTGAYFKERKYMSGFTGSAGTLVVTMEEAGLWTDGRYYIQAERELLGSGITLFKQGMEGVPSIEAYLEEKMPEHGCIGFDGRMIPAKWGFDLEERLKKKQVCIKYDLNLVDAIWQERPPMPKDKLFILDEKYSGEQTEQKLARLRSAMKEKQADIHILTTLDDIAWLYNLRGSDVVNTPVFLSYTMITEKDAVLFIDADKLDGKVRDYLENNHIQTAPYNDIYKAIKAIDSHKHVMADFDKINYAIAKSLTCSVINCQNPTLLFKAVKNETEIENLFKAHVKDGVAFTKFMYWLKCNVGKINMTEFSAAEYLDHERSKQEGFIDLSFETISAYNANAAMMHYSASEADCAELLPEGLLLVDSGGQYYEGTTDITRTMALGAVSDEIRLHYTTVLKSMLNLQSARFLYGCAGISLDILARGPIWDLNIDYRCGTGHGVGYLLSVHEAPNGFRWKVVPERFDSAVLEAGMVTTDEPGIYIEGSHGIRIENELVCRKGEANEYGQFMYFEPLTFAPIDLDLIDERYMSPIDKARLNDYHKLVYKTLAPHLDDEERAWLLQYTKAI